MKKQIIIKDWKYSSGVACNKVTSEIIYEKKIDGHFEYFSFDNKYIGRYNSDVSLFRDGLILVVLDPEY